MNVGIWIVSILLLVFGIAIIAVVLLQEGHQANLSGAIAGGADSFLGKGKGRTLDAFLNKSTKAIAVIFFLLALACDFLIFLKG